MVKSKRNESVILISAVLVVLLVAVVILKPSLLQSSLGGFSTLSLTTGTNYISSDPQLNAPAYVLAIVADGSSGYLRGTFQPSDVRAYTNSYEPSASFDITATVNDSRGCTYTILATPVFQVWTYDTFQYPCTTNGGAYCTFPRGYQSGDVYQVDSVTHYDSSINISLETSNNTYSIMLSPTSMSGQIGNVVRANFVGSLMGAQSCPVPSSDTVFYRPINSNVLYPKPSYFLAQLPQIQPVGAGYIDQPLYQPAGTSIPNANSIANSFMSASAPQTSSYCSPPTYDASQTTYYCSPVSPVALPLLKMYVNAAVLGVVIPSGNPKILSIGTPEIQSAQTTAIPVTIMNIGTETDSFDVSIHGTPNINLQSTRVSLTAGQTSTVNVLIQGSGIIGNYIVTAASVNNPSKMDNYTVKLKIDPFCDKPVESGKIKVFTEYGCYYVCSNQYSNDVREKTCQTFGSFEPRGAYNSLTQSGVDASGNATFANINLNGEYHCLASKQYTTLEGYMDYVFSPIVSGGQLTGSINYARTFKPQEKTGLVWLPAPICDYVGLYGYHNVNGQAVLIDTEIYQYGPQPASGVQQPGGIVINCQSGYVYDTASNSCKISSVPSPNPTPTCPAGLIYNPSAGACQPYNNQTIVCSGGTVFNITSKQCETPVTPAPPPIVCPSGYKISNGHCYQDSIALVGLGVLILFVGAFLFFNRKRIKV